MVSRIVSSTGVSMLVLCCVLVLAAAADVAQPPARPQITNSSQPPSGPQSGAQPPARPQIIPANVTQPPSASKTTSKTLEPKISPGNPSTRAPNSRETNDKCKGPPTCIPFTEWGQHKPHPLNCTLFLFCEQNGTATLKICPKDEEFDEKTHLCSINAGCVPCQRPDPIPSKPPSPTSPPGLATTTTTLRPSPCGGTALRVGGTTQLLTLTLVLCTALRHLAS